MESAFFFNNKDGDNKRFAQKEGPGTVTSRFGLADDDYAVQGIDLNEQLVRNKPATFFFRVSGSSMINAGIAAGDIVIVDRSIQPKSGMIVIAVIDGEMLLRRLEITLTSMLLVPETPKLATINVSGFSGLKIWGVVIYLIRSV